MRESHPGISLPPAAEPAWRAYCAMLASKDAHFAELRRQHEKRNAGEQSTLAEAAYIERLLSEHDLAVNAFTAAMRALEDADRNTLLALITEINREIGGPETPN